MFVLIFALASLLFTVAERDSINGYCDASSKSCSSSREKLIFYDVNPPEGFNLRRDVYMRFAIMLAEAQKRGNKLHWSLVLQPWDRLYHWKSRFSKPLLWREFFDIPSLKSYAPVLELDEILTTESRINLDRLYVLQNFEDAFEGGTFKEKWEVVNDCDYNIQNWGNAEVTAKEIICVKFQGKISQLWEVISQHPTDKKIMFAHGEIPLHDSYGTKSFWDCRKSMKFSKQLNAIANTFIQTHFDCIVDKCNSYIGIHWRRQDFAAHRKVPTVNGTVKQIDKAVRKYAPHVRKIFIATDASSTELRNLKKELRKLHYEAVSYTPTMTELDRIKDGGVAIIDQIICSRSAYFIGTHESTFSFRIQEEREILGFDSSTTFNMFCPDTGKCGEVSKWTIVN